MTRLQALGGLIACGLLGGAGPACADSAATAVAAPPAKDLRSVEVRYGEFDLSKPAGTQALYRRIKAAARQVCGPLDVRSAPLMRRWQDCYDTTLANAVASMDRPMLTALYRKELVARLERDRKQAQLSAQLSTQDIATWSCILSWL